MTEGIKEKFIAFIDILGFKHKIELVENNNGLTLKKLKNIIKCLGSDKDVEKYKKNGPEICPESNYINDDLDFKITRVSDCIIVSSEISPVGLINLMSYCCGSIFELLSKGIMCRGYILKGNIYHTNSSDEEEGLFLGTGYQRAYEKERGTPFVEIDSEICNYIETMEDPCVKKMFNRFVLSDDNVTALFPFKKLSHNFKITGDGLNSQFKAKNHRESNDRMRQRIKKMEEDIMSYVDSSNEKVMGKAKHYINALNKQLENCDKADKVIDIFGR
ncbi:hypothetical protein C8C77_1159 [Halanaerobium saccharolyticum]|uniref:Uncharacterized protein n=1 Tax=Halanaerobium saccharolyticum TaxID=43595 RepID=A0A4R7YYZ7_9FIRM|nr:hypothetical protein [Halanaerobium saccharolyticum]RAK08993.1 hypothetical protein C7958_108114 [Halanaerobium saccharolyticum]TDW02613.1 hypothetical protein C8C77_1159 [Halanaerobium saccharolyticum]TDX60756.1 hypothetical protein C7956_108114 [Halanaerobium saccharolyticum]